jgi:hypothetical protein
MGWLRLMNNIYKFFKLSNNKKSLIIKSLILIIFIRISLTILRFSNVLKISKRFSRSNNNPKNNRPIEDIVWSINVVSPYVPRATCLTQAITAQILLYRHNHASKLKIGVMKKGDFEAHAWIEINNEIVLGESEEKYMPILNLNN